MTKDCINHWVINPLQKSTINSLLDDKWDWSSNVYGRKEGAIFALSSFKKYEKIYLKEYGILS